MGKGRVDCFEWFSGEYCSVVKEFLGLIRV